MHRIWLTILVMVGVGFLLLLNGWQPARGKVQYAATSGQADYKTEIDAYIEAQMRELKIPGLALAIVRGDRIEYARGYGVADDAGRPVTPQTPFLVASLSKSITAVGVMQLVEAGRIDLDAPVRAYLPWFRTADNEASARITIRHLLNQTSGLSELEGAMRNLDRDPAEDALESSVRALSNARLKADPGERYEYSNTNYDILGLVIQTVTGIPYETYIEDNVFTPLQMQNSYTSLEKARAGGLSTGYVSFFGLTLDYDRLMPYSRTVVPSAGLFSSADDMARYLLFHLNGGRYPEQAAVLSGDGLIELHIPGVVINDKVQYAKGWVTWPFPELAAANGSRGIVPTVLSHGGEGANFMSMVVMVPDLQLGVVVLVNKIDHRREESYAHIVWNTVLLAAGLEPKMVPGSPGFLDRYGQVTGMGVLVLLAASFFFSMRLLIQRPRAFSPRVVLVFAVLLLFDLAIAGYILFVEMAPSETTLALTLTYYLEVGVIYIAVLIFALGLGFLRTGLLLAQLLKNRARV